MAPLSGRVLHMIWVSPLGSKLLARMFNIGERNLQSTVGKMDAELGDRKIASRIVSNMAKPKSLPQF